MSATIKVEVSCAECGDDLDVEGEASPHDGAEARAQFTIKPCEKCIERAKADAADEAIAEYKREQAANA